MNTKPRSIIGIGLVAAVAAGGSSGTALAAERLPVGPKCVKSEQGKCLPLAPASKRVDLVKPTFSNPTKITNPLFPVAKGTQVLLGGNVDGEPFRVEYTVLPQTKTIKWDGKKVRTVVQQYVAYLNGRIEEVALDWYAQADDGAVWYFGEDVFNYRNGVVADREGTWIVGKQSPPAMIMPAKPKVGDVYRPENAPGIVFEEVQVKRVGKTVEGPLGQVKGALVVNELHQDGKREEKTFAPGYGEFVTGNVQGDVEAVTLAVPRDRLKTPTPPALTTLASEANAAFDAASQQQFAAVRGGLQRMTAAYRSGQVSKPIAADLNRALEALTKAAGSNSVARSRQAALDVAQASLDLQLRHRSIEQIDLARLDLRARQLLIDAAGNDRGAVIGDVEVLELIRDRVRHVAPGSEAKRLDALLRGLRRAADAKDVAGAAAKIPGLRDTIARIQSQVPGLGASVR